MPEELLSIGRFARLCRLSVKQLRHYDELGLLSPAQVDAVTGYRYYRRDQLRDAMAVALLRTLDVPLPAIAQVLTSDETIQAAVLRAEHERLAARLAHQQRTLRALERLLREGVLQREVTLSREPACRLLTVRDVCAPDEIGATTGRCVGQLTAALAGRTVSSPFWGIFPVDLTAQIRVTVGVELVNGIDPEPGVVVEHLPAGLVASAVHVGPYEQLALTYQAVFAWIHERGLRPRGTVREAYLTDPTTTDPAQLTTRIVVPVDDVEECE